MKTILDIIKKYEIFNKKFIEYGYEDMEKLYAQFEIDKNNKKIFTPIDDFLRALRHKIKFCDENIRENLMLDLMENNFCPFVRTYHEDWGLEEVDMYTSRYTSEKEIKAITWTIDYRSYSFALVELVISEKIRSILY